MIERFSASVADKHTACHASANLSAAIPGWEPPDDDEELTATGKLRANIKGERMHKLLEQAAEFSPKEMAAVAEAMAYVAQLRTQRRFKMLTEASGTGWWLQRQPKTTTDVVLYVQDEIHVVDYKFGKIEVPAHDNSQGKYYSLAFLPLAPKAKHVTFHIVQPLADNIDSVEFSMAELDQFRQETAAAEAAILAGSVQFTPGDHCTFCPANPHSRAPKGTPLCPAMMDLLYPREPLDEDAILDLVD